MIGLTRPGPLERELGVNPGNNLNSSRRGKGYPARLGQTTLNLIPTSVSRNLHSLLGRTRAR